MRRALWLLFLLPVLAAYDYGAGIPTFFARNAPSGATVIFGPETFEPNDDGDCLNYLTQVGPNATSTSGTDSTNCDYTGVVLNGSYSLLTDPLGNDPDANASVWWNSNWDSAVDDGDMTIKFLLRASTLVTCGTCGGWRSLFQTNDATVTKGIQLKVRYDDSPASNVNFIMTADGMQASPLECITIAADTTYEVCIKYNVDDDDVDTYIDATPDGTFCEVANFCETIDGSGDGSGIDGHRIQNQYGGADHYGVWIFDDIQVETE